ncbi:ndufb9 [Mactra antiquata]
MVQDVTMDGSFQYFTSYCDDEDRFPARFLMMKMRGQLEENRNVEPKVAKELVADFEKQVKHIETPFPLRFANSPGGTNFGRSMPDPDWVLDTWHPFEKAQYPSYFALRDIRKREFLERNERLMQEMDVATKK